MDEKRLLELIGEQFQLPPGELGLENKAEDFVEWDSMGTLSVTTMLAHEGINFDPGDTKSLQSVRGILEVCRKAGKLD